MMAKAISKQTRQPNVLHLLPKKNEVENWMCSLWGTLDVIPGISHARRLEGVGGFPYFHHKDDD